MLIGDAKVLAETLRTAGRETISKPMEAMVSCIESLEKANAVFDRNGDSYDKKHNRD